MKRAFRESEWLHIEGVSNLTLKYINSLQLTKELLPIKKHFRTEN